MTKLTKERLKFFAAEEAASLLARLTEFLGERGTGGYAVGGFVRDGLIGRANSDIDVAVSGDAREIASGVAEAFGCKMVPLDDVNQVARVVHHRDERHWHLDFSTLRGTIEQDLSCRDFTVNAIAIELGEIKAGWGQVRVIDPLGGGRDLSQRVIRAVSSEVFREDPARLIRAVRLVAMLDFTLNQDTRALIRRDCQLLTTVAAERVRDELGYILNTPRAYHALRQLDDLGLLDPLMPELAVTRSVEQPKEHFWDVFEHSLETVAAVERILEEREHREDDDVLRSVPCSPDIAKHFKEEIGGGRTRLALLKLAALLHDIAKPATKTIEPDGRMRFLGHAQEGAAMAVQLMERLRFSKRETKMVQLMVENHLRPGYPASEEPPSHRAVYRYFRDTGDAGIDTLFLGLADHLAARGPMLDLSQWCKHTDTAHYMLHKWFEDQAAVVPPKLIDGHILMERFGLAPGPQIGELLQEVRESQGAGEIATTEEALDFVERKLGSST